QMRNGTIALRRLAWVLGGIWAVEAMLFNAPASNILPPGFRPLPPGTHALVGGKVIPKPGEVIDGGGIVIRDGKIKEAGKGIAPPEDARVWDMRGMVVYAGFIDPYLVLNPSNTPASTAESEPVLRNDLTAGMVTFFGAPAQRTDKENAGPGYEIAK